MWIYLSACKSTVKKGKGVCFAKASNLHDMINQITQNKQAAQDDEGSQWSLIPKRLRPPYPSFSFLSFFFTLIMTRAMKKENKRPIFFWISNKVTKQNRIKQEAQFQKLTWISLIEMGMWGTLFRTKKRPQIQKLLLQRTLNLKKSPKLELKGYFVSPKRQLGMKSHPYSNSSKFKSCWSYSKSDKDAAEQEIPTKASNWDSV